MLKRKAALTRSKSTVFLKDLFALIHKPNYLYDDRILNQQMRLGVPNDITNTQKMFNSVLVVNFILRTLFDLGFRF